MMDSLEFHSQDIEPNTREVDHAQNQQSVCGRQELAQLIGRLLAKRWLRQHRDDSETAAEDKHIAVRSAETS
jgi:hypothetical protein